MSNNLLKRVSIFDKIRNKVKHILGYREPGRFMIDTQPEFKKIGNIKQSRIANIEENLKKILYENSKQETPREGITEKDAIDLLEWTVQNAREGLAKAMRVPDISEQDLMGFCGMGQGITAITLQNMGLSPNALNVGEIAGSQAGRHAFVTVNIPIKLEDGTIRNKAYLVDTTFRQFYLISNYTNQYGDYIQDKRYGGKVPSMPGYWMLKQGRKGRELSEEILSKGFFELTEENAKIYFDANYLTGVKRKRATKVPKRSELKTGIDGAEYIRRTEDKNNQEELDFTESELNTNGINTRTPLMQKQEVSRVYNLVEQMDNREINSQSINEERQE